MLSNNENSHLVTTKDISQSIFNSPAPYKAIASHAYPNSLKNQLKCRLRMKVHKKSTLDVLELYQEQQLELFVCRYPEQLVKHLRPYFSVVSTPVQRIEIMTKHYQLLRLRLAHWIQPAYLEEGLLITDLDEEFSLVIKFEPTFRREGELTLSVINRSGQRVYSCAFVFSGSRRQCSIIMTAIQGPEPSIEEPMAVVRDLTKAAHGLRPKPLLITVMKVIAKALGSEEIYAL